MRLNRHAAAALAGSALLLVGGGAALAAAGGGDRGTRCDERLAKIAERRGVTVEQLQADVKARLLARIDAAEKAGRDLLGARSGLANAHLRGNAVRWASPRQGTRRRPGDAEGSRRLPPARPRGASRTAPGKLSRSARREAGQERVGARGRDGRAGQGASGEGGREREDHAGAGGRSAGAARARRRNGSRRRCSRPAEASRRHDRSEGPSGGPFAVS